MITIDKRKRIIRFHKDFKIGQDPQPTFEKKLITGYVCPKCKQVLLAYFHTDQIIPTWDYDERECSSAKPKRYTQKGMKDLQYRVFWTGSGIQGIELKSEKHTEKQYKHYSVPDYDQECNYKIMPIYNLIESVNMIISKMQHNLADINKKERLTLSLIPEDFNTDILLKNIKQFKWIDLIPEVCRSRDPMLHYNLKFVFNEYICGYDFTYAKGDKRKKARNTYKQMKEAYKGVAYKLAAT